MCRLRTVKTSSSSPPSYRARRLASRTPSSPMWFVWALMLAVINVAVANVATWNEVPVLVDPLLCHYLRQQSNRTEKEEEIFSLCRSNSSNNQSESLRWIRAVDNNVIQSKSRAQKKPLSRLPPDQKEMILHLHNEFRAQVNPPAADMRFMKWNDTLAAQAQQWADGCQFVHGRPEGTDLNVGQNLYAGPDPSGIRAVQLWFEEITFYDFEEDYCEPGEQCGHYLQLAWSITEFVGCAVAKCIFHGFLYVCHYAPRGNHPEVSPYIVGAPCSQCRNRRDGGLCANKTCVTKEECDKYQLRCYCELKCQNCASFNPGACGCSCKKGWDSLDCSKLCEDTHENCREDVGWPDIFSCSMEDNKVRDEFCRKMCKQCNPLLEQDENSNSPRVCCGGTLCEEGMVLDENCNCVDLCPGPICQEKKKESVWQEKNVEDEMIEELNKETESEEKSWALSDMQTDSAMKISDFYIDVSFLICFCFISGLINSA